MSWEAFSSPELLSMNFLRPLRFCIRLITSISWPLMLLIIYSKYLLSDIFWLSSLEFEPKLALFCKLTMLFWSSIFMFRREYLKSYDIATFSMDRLLKFIILSYLDPFLPRFASKVSLLDPFMNPKPPNWLFAAIWLPKFPLKAILLSLGP